MFLHQAKLIRGKHHTSTFTREADAELADLSGQDGSRLLVTSSKITSRGSSTMIRAIEARWTCPSLLDRKDEPYVQEEDGEEGSIETAEVSV